MKYTLELLSLYECVGTAFWAMVMRLLMGHENFGTGPTPGPLPIQLMLRALRASPISPVHAALGLVCANLNLLVLVGLFLLSKSRTERKFYIGRLTLIPSLLWRRLWLVPTGRERLWDRVADGVYLGSLPVFYDMKRLELDGITSVVNLCEETEGPASEYECHGIDQLHLPTVDRVQPTQEVIGKAVNYIRQQVSRGRVVLVHCKAGRGRSALIVYCYLVTCLGHAPPVALALLEECRPSVSPNIHRRMEGVKYIEYVQQVMQTAKSIDASKLGVRRRT